MKRLIQILSIFLVLTLALSSCGKQSGSSNYSAAESDAPGEAMDDTSSFSSDASDSSAQMTSEYFSNRDFEVGYDESESAIITLKGDTASSSSDAVQISGTTITIMDEGTYVLSGTLNNGMIVVDSEKTDKTQLVLNGVTINSETSAAIYILQSDKVFLTTAAGTTNTLSNGGSFVAIDENNIDAVIFSKEDVTLNGSGTLVVTSPAGHGIVSKDSLALTSGSYDINCASHALAGKDDVRIANADLTIVSGKDGIHAENAEDATLGFVYIQSGTLQISSQGDGISAASYLKIEDGSFDIISGGGSANGSSKTSNSWGSFMGGGRHQGRGMGNLPNNTATQTATEDSSTSIKGIKSSGDMSINGGRFTINSADDTIHSNASLEIHGGVFALASGDDAIHADETLTVHGGTIHISESYEGLEALHVYVTGGEITLVAIDDGLNAAGGMDSSGTKGRGDDRFGAPNNRGTGAVSNGSITISGGTLYIEASGDGIDANGTLEISGGHTTVCGPNYGDTATLDYDISGAITGGTFIGTGASRMAQTFGDATQGVIAINAGSQAAGTTISLSDKNGNSMLTHTPKLPYEVVILSSPDIISGEVYTITVGSSTGEFTAD
ncbi:MAG: carbohydrate-binding domain-containing protein [Roseburia sp.]